jgi:hypothetical protein
VPLIFTGRALTGIAEFKNETITTVVGRCFAVSFLPRIRVVRRNCDYFVTRSHGSRFPRTTSTSSVPPTSSRSRHTSALTRQYLADAAYSARFIYVVNFRRGDFCRRGRGDPCGEPDEHRAAGSSRDSSQA